MKRRFTDEQVIGILREQEAGSAVKEITRRHGISEQSFYRWQAKYGGMDVSDARRLKELEAGNAKLKRFLAEAQLDNAALKASRSDGRQARSAESGEASRQTERGFTSGLGAWLQSAPGVPSGLSRFLYLAVQGPRRRTPWPA